ncbi:hypothetical protein ACXJY6_10865 [Vibrio sp. RC27]
MKTIEYFYNKHIHAARKVAKGLTGLDRAEAIYHYFEGNTTHPHAWYTYQQEMLNRRSDHKFPIDLMKKMAISVAENEWLLHNSQNNQPK